MCSCGGGSTLKGLRLPRLPKGGWRCSCTYGAVSARARQALNSSYMRASRFARSFSMAFLSSASFACAWNELAVGMPLWTSTADSLAYRSP